MEQCCGTTCDKAKLEAEFKIIGAMEFVQFLEESITEDCSTVAIDELLQEFVRGVSR